VPWVIVAVMLFKLSEDIAECYRRAEEARQKAEETADPSIKSDFYDLERRWLFLAHSYQFTERLSEFQKRPTGSKG
jgi:hypothetical protein